MKKKIYIIITASVVFTLIFVVFISQRFNFMNFTTNSTKPYLIKVTVVSKNFETITFSEIKPVVFFDASHVISRLRNRDKDLSLRPFTDIPSSMSTFSVENKSLNNVEVGQKFWIKYYPIEESIEL